MQVRGAVILIRKVFFEQGTNGQKAEVQSACKPRQHDGGTAVSKGPQRPCGASCSCIDSSLCCDTGGLARLGAGKIHRLVCKR